MEHRIGICGTGLMGATMAQIFAEKGYETRIYGRTDASIERAKGIITLKEDIPLYYTTRLEDLGECDIIIESIVEDLAVKQEFFERLSKIVRPGNDSGDEYVGIVYEPDLRAGTRQRTFSRNALV